MRVYSFALLTAAAFLLPSAAKANCQLVKFLELPVTMRGARPIVSAQIEGKDAQFMLDSGAFFSVISPATAQTYGLRTTDLPPGFLLKGINGTTSGSLAVARTFGIAGLTLPNIRFIVAGTDTGQAGVLGQNLLGISDVEYDLRHGAVRLLRAKGCKVEELAYWASDNPITLIPLERRTPEQRHTIGTVTLNGVKLRAVFDTGAPGTLLTVSAARKAGVTPSTPGVFDAGTTFGFGTQSLRTWIGSFDRLEIGGESIPHPKLRFSEAQLDDADMLIGADFFLTHRVYVSNDQSKMLFSYEGGAVFGINPSGAKDDKGKALDLADRTAAPSDAEGLSRRGAASASSGNFEAAIADFDRAIELAPGEARYYRQRAAARLANRQPLLAAADLDKALAIDPGDVDSRMMRARMRLAAHDPAGAGEDIRLLDRQLTSSAGERLQLAGMADAAGLLELAVANEDAWLKAHPEDAQRPAALNGRCWVLAQLNRDLDKALGDCNAALRARPNAAAYLDSRGLVRVRLGDFARALADYNAALALQPRNAWTLYMRGLVKTKMGDPAGAEADRKAALAIAPDVSERAVKLGLEY